MDYSIALSVVYCLMIFVLIVIRKYQKKYSSNAKTEKILSDFKGVDLTKLQNNYEILNKMLDNIKTNSEKYDKKKIEMSCKRNDNQKAC